MFYFDYIQYRKKQLEKIVTYIIIFTNPNYSNLTTFKNTRRKKYIVLLLIKPTFQLIFSY